MVAAMPASARCAPGATVSTVHAPAALTFTTSPGDRYHDSPWACGLDVEAETKTTRYMAEQSVDAGTSALEATPGNSSCTASQASEPSFEGDTAVLSTFQMRPHHSSVAESRLQSLSSSLLPY